MLARGGSAMATDRTSLSFCACACVIAACVPAAAAAGPTTTTAPATRPARHPLGDLPERWRVYKLAWAGGNLERQLLTDRRLVSGLLRGDASEVGALRDLMIREYDRLTGLAAVEDYRCGRLASLVAVAWTAVPTGKSLGPVQAARNTQLMCGEVCRWAERAITHFAAGIDEKRWKQHQAFLPGAVAGMMSLIPSRAVWIDQPGRLRDGLQRLRPSLEKVLAAGGDGQQHGDLIEKFYKTIEPYGRLEADKQAVRKLLMAFRTAYNDRDDKTFIALWPAGHKATGSLKKRSLASKIPPDLWKIALWEPLYIVARGDLAGAYVVSQYRSKAGKLHPARLQRFPAKRGKKEGWKLN